MDRIEELFRNPGLIETLRSQGPESVVKFITKYLDKKNTNRVEKFTRLVCFPSVPFTSDIDPEKIKACGWDDFAASVFYYMLDNTDNKRIIRTNEEEQRLYGLTPPPELYCNSSRDTRYRCFLLSLNHNMDILVCRALRYKPEEKEFMVGVICFAEQKHRYFEDFNFIMRLKVEDIPPDIIIRIGDYFRAVFYMTDIDTRKIYVSMKIEHLLRTSSLSLRIITEDEFPLHHKLMQERPFNSIENLMGLGTKKIMNQAANICREFNIGHTNLYSIKYPELESFDVPEEEKVTSFHLEHCREVAAELFHVAREEFVKNNNVKKSLETFAEGFKYQPNNIGALINRAAVYAGNSNLAKARMDLEKCLRIESECPRALEYMSQILKTQAHEFEQKGNYLGVANALFRMLQLPECYRSPNLQKKFLKAVIIYDLQFLLCPLTEVTQEDFNLERDGDEVEEAENYDDDEVSLPDSSYTREQYDREVQSAVDMDISNEPINNDIEEPGTSTGIRKRNKRHKRKHSRHKEHKRHKHESRRRHESSYSPIHRTKSRSPSSSRRHKKSSHGKVRYSRSPSPYHHSRSYYSRSKSPRRPQHSESVSPRRLQESRSISPRRLPDSRSISPRRLQDSRSKSPRRLHDSRSKSPRRLHDSRSRSPRRMHDSRSKSPRRPQHSRSRSPRRPRHSRSRSPYRRYRRSHSNSPRGFHYSPHTSTSPYHYRKSPRHRSSSSS